jgi:hypothetical protein
LHEITFCSQSFACENGPLELHQEKQLNIDLVVVDAFAANLKSRHLMSFMAVSALNGASTPPGKQRGSNRYRKCHRFGYGRQSQGEDHALIDSVSAVGHPIKRVAGEEQVAGRIGAGGNVERMEN